MELREKGYLAEAALSREFETRGPEHLGRLANLFAATLAQLPAVKIDRPPRMADFAHLGEAMLRGRAKPGAPSWGSITSNRRELHHPWPEKQSPVAATEFAPLVDNQHPTDPSGFVFERGMSVLLEKLADGPRHQE